MFPLHDDNPTSVRPVVTVSIIAICVIAFLWQLSLGAQGQMAANYALGVVPAVLLGPEKLPPQVAMVPEWITVFTSMFLHGGWLHLLGNMLYLWIFGNNVEDAMGHGRFVLFYLTCGVIAVLAHAFPNADSTIPMIGASGAIAGVLGAYLLLYPHARVLVAIPFGFIIHTVRLPAGWVLGFWFVIQIVSSAMGDGKPGGVAWGAHVGGFVAGICLIPLFKYRHVRLLAPGRRTAGYK